jgi:glutamate dehydrogenase/leucine dehydrogenase
MRQKLTNQSPQIDEKAFIYSRQGNGTVEVGVLIPDAIFEKLNEEQVNRIISNFIVELSGMALGQNEPSSKRIN